MFCVQAILGAGPSTAAGQGPSEPRSRSYGSIRSPGEISIRSPNGVPELWSLEASYSGSGRHGKAKYGTPLAGTPTPITIRKYPNKIPKDDERQPLLGSGETAPGVEPLSGIKVEEEKNLLDDLKKELETDMHSIGIQELYARFGTDPVQVCPEI